MHRRFFGCRTKGQCARLMETLAAPGVLLTAEWRWLAMLNYEVEPALLQSRVPMGTELDTWNGQTFVSVVGFRFLNTRLFGVAVPFHRDFDEVNLRFYVRRRAPDGGAAESSLSASSSPALPWRPWPDSRMANATRPY